MRERESTQGNIVYTCYVNLPPNPHVDHAILAQTVRRSTGQFTQYIQVSVMDQCQEANRNMITVFTIRWVNGVNN